MGGRKRPRILSGPKLSPLTVRSSGFLRYLTGGEPILLDGFSQQLSQSLTVLTNFAVERKSLAPGRVISEAGNWSKPASGRITLFWAAAPIALPLGGFGWKQNNGI
jgi:hypothetical protein